MSEWNEERSEIASALSDVAHAITPSAFPAPDATGGTVASLTEAVMGITAGLVKVADAIEYLADAVSTRENLDE